MVRPYAFKQVRVPREFRMIRRVGKFDRYLRGLGPDGVLYCIQQTAFQPPQINLRISTCYPYCEPPRSLELRRLSEFESSLEDPREPALFDIGPIVVRRQRYEYHHVYMPFP